jgi:DAK2 domain fusion protein YloV
VPDNLDASVVRRWFAAGSAALRRHEHEINQLNVYPVPDGDTGTNMLLTMCAAERALPAGPPGDAGGGDAAAALRAGADGALLGARGNSGVILAQLLRGLADALDGVSSPDGADLAEALAAAAKAAHDAVAEPVEGTILSVATAAAEAAVAAGQRGLATVTRSAADAAAVALARTPQQLPVLAAAGVVDAGGRGLVVLLDALVEVVTGEAPQRPSEPSPPPSRTGPTGPREQGSPAYAYEVQYLLEADDQAVARLRSRLGQLGDSLVIVGGGDRPWNVHVHVNDVGAAVEAGVEAGRPYRITVTRFDDPQAHPAGHTAGDPAGHAADPAGHAATCAAGPVTGSSGPPANPGDRAALVMAAGDGLRDLFAREGAVVVDASPATGEVLEAVRATGARQVVVLPNDPDTQAVAAAAARAAAAEGIRVQVVPTHSPVQALAALAVRDPQRDFDDDVIAMAEAAGACRYAEVCRASREALTVVGRCRPGDVLALVEGEVHLIGRDLTEVCRRLLDRLLGGGGELVTLVVGADAPPGLGDELVAHLASSWPLVEVQLHAGGQPHYALLVGVE